MARIKIRGRLEHIEVSNDVARKVKQRKFGLDGVEKAEPNDLVDLGEWSGEYSRVVEIEMTKTENPQNDPQAEREREEREQRERWLKMSPEAKAEHTGRFKLTYAMRLGDFKADPPEKVLEQVKKRLVKFYKENPKKTKYPHDLLDDLLPPQKRQGLATTMRVGADTNRECINPKCNNKLPAYVKDFCSGQCMLDVQNGELSTK